MDLDRYAPAERRRSASVGCGGLRESETRAKRCRHQPCKKGKPAMIALHTPLTEAQIRSLHVGDEVSLSGIVFTGRDAVHKYLHEGGALPPGVQLRDGVLYHCGPVMLREPDGSWRCAAAGPTTSAREEPYQAEIIRKYGIRAVIGKGGMGARTLAACKECGAVYLHAVGGAAQVLAERVKRVRNVYFLEEFGAPEAIWELEVEDFPAVVTMDAHGKSLHDEIFERSRAELLKRL
ncbi:MAG: FumA C-terminus/TtdB family hydratase beta subunit [Limisphaera sp.]